MIRSMTGFGRCEKEIDGYKVSVELKSVNNRYADITVKMPRYYSYLEDYIREYLKGQINRGKAEVFVRIDRVGEADCTVSVNHAYAKNYIDALWELRDTYALSDDISVSSVASNSDVFDFDRAEEDEELVKNILTQVLAEALESFIEMRKAEGARLKSDIEEKLGFIRQAVEKIEKIEPEVVKEYQVRLEEKITALLAGAEVDKSRVLTEVAIFADKAAIDEEMVRLKSHLKAFSEALDTNGPVGKKLDFILQEMNREINTTGSKANNISISQIVIDVKYELEKIREQIQNIE